MPIGRAPAAARSRTSAPPPQPMSTTSLPAGATRRSSIEVSVGGAVGTGGSSADLIVVLEAGRMVESGSHDDLMRARGTYAELFELQARAYR